MQPQDPELAQLLNRFVPVRVTNFKGVDMNFFQFDYDLTFAVLMMNPNGHTYSRFGTNDHKEGTARMSITGLKHAMRGVLQTHAENKAAAPAPKPKFTLEAIPAFRTSKAAKGDCYHCHYAGQFGLQQSMREGKFAKEMLFRHPLPENIGVTLDVDRNNVVRAVLPESPAAKAGVRVGDTIVQAESLPVWTSADLQFALDTVKDPGVVTLGLERGGHKLPPVKLDLPRGWRRTDISWRASAGGIPPTMGFWGRPLNVDERRTRNLASDQLALQANFMFPGKEWERTRGGLRNGDIVVAVNGKSLPNMTMRQFHSYFRLNFNVGDTVTVTVLRGPQKLDLQVPCLDVSSE